MTATNPILKYQHNPELHLENAGDTKYYGVDRDVNPEAIKELEEYLKAKYKDFHRFCNFKTNKDGTKSVRMLSHYSSAFIGVAYVRVDEM